MKGKDKILPIKKTDKHPLFRGRIRRWYPIWSEKSFDITEYQCPICERWFNSSNNGWNTIGVRLHITKHAKSESVAKLLGELKKTPHFTFWKNHTHESTNYYNPREWSCV